MYPYVKTLFDDPTEDHTYVKGESGKVAGYMNDARGIPCAVVIFGKSMALVEFGHLEIIGY